MSGSPGYELVAETRFERDLLLLRNRTKADPRHLPLYREVLREIDALRSGTSNGHHPLGYEAGKGDLRDCVTCYLQSDPRRAADQRLVFREMRPAAPGELPRRELLAIKPRQGRGNVYEHTCARLGRHPADRQPGLDRFGDRLPGQQRNEAQRRAELDAKRAIAQAWAGQRPLQSSRVLRKAAGSAPGSATAPASARMPFERARSSPAPTGWPERGR